MGGSKQRINPYRREHLLDLTRRRMFNAAIEPGQRPEPLEVYIYGPGQGVGLYSITRKWVLVVIDGLQSTRWVGDTAIEAYERYATAVLNLTNRIRKRKRLPAL